MAWMRMMGAESVDYHRETVLGRADDPPGAALAYYASRGETPMRWGGAGAERLGLAGTVRDETYQAIFGPGGPVDPALGVRLASTKRPGMELVVAAHKSVALLGVMGRAEDMHELLDVERDAALAYLDDLTRRRGGRRGRASLPAATSGLVFAHTRHATSRAGDPAPHDHVLIANVVEMLDEPGGWKAADTALWREHLHAATAVGRTAAARRALELGYAIEPDDGVSGRLGHWRIAGMPVEAEELFSKRAAEIDEAVAEAGFDSYRARGVAARTTRRTKRFTPVDDLMAQWQVELAGIGLHLADLIRSVDRASAERPASSSVLTGDECRRLVEELVAGGGLLARRKVFSRRDVVVAVAPQVFGRDSAELPRVVDAVLGDSEILPLVGVAGASERAYACASVIAVESAIAAVVAKGVAATASAVVPAPAVDAALARKEPELRRPLTHGQARAVRGICQSGRQVVLVVGVAGSGKTTALSCVRDAYQAAGYQVVGTSTSAQAARTLGREASIDESRTLASLLWRLDHGRLALDNWTVVILDEAGMTADPDLLRVLVAAEAARAKVVLVGDDRQLGPVGPGGALAGLIDRAAGAVHLLDENVRQADRGERRALNRLRAGDVDAAVDWYAEHGRIAARPTRNEALDATVHAWLADTRSGSDTGLYAWRRANVAELNRRARAAWAAEGHLTGPEMGAPGGRCYAAGDRIVTLAPGSGTVTSERGVIEQVDPVRSRLLVHMDDGRRHILERDATAADRLDHGYAVTIHRAQGATVDVAHRFEDGGGRELAYVSMSRARQCSTVYVVADDLDQAVEDLRRDWSSERRPGWAIDTGSPTTEPLAAEQEPSAPADLRWALRRARLQAERDALMALIPPDRSREIVEAHFRIGELHDQLHDLKDGTGRYEHTDLGATARAHREAERRRAAVERALADPNAGWLARRSWRRELGAARGAEDELQVRWNDEVEPERARLAGALGDAERDAVELRRQADRDRSWRRSHPTVTERIRRIDRELSRERPDLNAIDPARCGGMPATPEFGLDL